ncbi:MAG: Gfo/Idh/MocA family oxidoreductase [Lentisphaerales bacterium]|nr:Gfo/Idh/MocA family oxidoreductase [Lentisphaerales bacterium]
MINVGIIGVDFIGAVHIEALRRLPGVNVKAIASSNLERAEQNAKNLAIDEFYGDWRQLLKDEAIDVVHIATPNNQHFDQVKAAIAAGKHVMCEKPLTMNSKEAKEVFDDAESKGIIHGVNFNIRFYPLMHQLKEMISKGELGRIHTVSGSYQQDWLLLETDYNWRLESAKSGDSRAVADIGSHWMDLAEFVSGQKIDEVCADFKTIHPVRKKPLKEVETYSGKMLQPEDYADVEIDTEDYASVLLNFENGAGGVFTVSQCAAGRKNRAYLEIHGTKKSIAWDSELCNQLWVGSRESMNSLLLRDASLMHSESHKTVDYPGGHNEGFPDTFKQLYKDFYKDVALGSKSDSSTYATFKDGIRELQLTERIVESNEKRGWLKI